MQVLFIDLNNHLSFKDGYIQALRQAGFEVILPDEEIRASADFIEKARTLDELDLIITEQRMNVPENWSPDFCQQGTRVGNEIIRRVRITHPDLPVVILTGIYDDDDREKNQHKLNVYYFRDWETSRACLVKIVHEILDLTD